MRKTRHAGMAQSVEHVIGNDEVISSILITSSNKAAGLNRGLPLLVFYKLFKILDFDIDFFSWIAVY